MKQGVSAAEPSAELEGEIQRNIRLAAGRAVPGCVLWRNNSGVAFHRDGSKVRYGVGKGGADLIGILMVGGLGLFLAVEVKTSTGRLSEDQRMFIALVGRAGGIGIVARSVDDFVRQATAARRGYEGRITGVPASGATL